MSKLIASNNSTVLSRDYPYHLPFVLKENRFSNQRQNLNLSMNASDISILNKESDKTKTSILNAKIAESLKAYSHGLKITSAPITNLSLSASLVVEPKLKRICRQETNPLPSLYACHNKSKKERAASVTFQAKNRVLKKLPSDCSQKTQDTSRDSKESRENKEKEEVEKSKPKISVPSLLLNGNPLAFVRKTTGDSSFTLSSDDTKIEQEREREKLPVKIREMRMNRLSFERDLSTTKSSNSRCNVSFDAINLKVSDIDTKCRTNKERPLITLDQLKFKPSGEKEPINMSVLIRKFANKRRKV